MISEQSSPTPVLIFSLVIPDFLSNKGRRGEKKETLVPCVQSWNDMLSLQQWARQKRKKEVQGAFLSALRASASDSSTRTISVRNMLSIAADTLVSYQETVLEKRKLRLANAKLKKAKKATP